MSEYNLHFGCAPKAQKTKPYYFCSVPLEKTLGLERARGVAKLSAEMPHMGAHSFIIEAEDGSVREVWEKRNGAWVQEK